MNWCGRGSCQRVKGSNCLQNDLCLIEIDTHPECLLSPERVYGRGWQPNAHARHPHAPESLELSSPTDGPSLATHPHLFCLFLYGQEELTNSAARSPFRSLQTNPIAIDLLRLMAACNDLIALAEWASVDKYKRRI